MHRYNNIDLPACKDKGISVCNIPTYATEAMAHMAITLVMALSCSLVQQSQALSSGNREYMKQCHLGSLAHFELTGKTLGLVGGMGTIGRRVGAMARALGMQVVVSDLPATPVGPRHELGLTVVSFDELMARSDFVSVHCPLNEHTKGLIGTAALAAMKVRRGVKLCEKDEEMLLTFIQVLCSHLRTSSTRRAAPSSTRTRSSVPCVRSG